MVSILVKMVESMKVNSPIIKNLVMVSKFMLMAIYTSVNSKMEKNMEMANFSGLIYRVKIQNKTNLSNIMMGNGGEAFQMALVSTKKLMVSFFTYSGDLYTGNFKNGLKHG